MNFLEWVAIQPHVYFYILHSSSSPFIIISFSLQIYSVLEDLNAILDDQWMGGGIAGGHGLVLVMHLLKEQQSFCKFVHLLTDQYSLLCDGINCLKPFHKALCNVSTTTYIILMTCAMKLVSFVFMH